MPPSKVLRFAAPLGTSMPDPSALVTALLCAVGFLWPGISSSEQSALGGLRLSARAFPEGSIAAPKIDRFRCAACVWCLLTGVGSIVELRSLLSSFHLSSAVYHSFLSGHAGFDPSRRLESSVAVMAPMMAVRAATCMESRFQSDHVATSWAGSHGGCPRMGRATPNRRTSDPRKPLLPADVAYTLARHKLRFLKV